MLIAAQCPPDGRNRLVVRGYNRSDLSAFGFERMADGMWLSDKATFKTGDLLAWFPGFDPRRDIAEMDTADFLIGYEDLDLVDDSTLLDELVRRGTPGVAQPTFADQVAAMRAAASPDEVAAVVADFPAETLVSPLDEVIEAKTREWYLKDFAIPKNPGKAEEHVASLTAASERDLTADIERYNDLRTRGVDALSDYDIGVAYSGDALMALKQSLRAKQSHILFQRRKLALLGELATGPQAGEATAPASDEEPSGQEEVVGRGRAPKSPARQRQRIEDAGEKIGGARKDYYAKALTRADLAEMNDREKLELVTRDNIWPRKSLSEFRDEGVDCRVALFVNAIRKDIPSTITDPAHSDIYIDLVSKLRDCAARLQSPEELAYISGTERWTPFELMLKEAGILDLEVRHDSIGRGLGDRFSEFLFQSPQYRRFSQNYIYDSPRGYRRAKSTYDGHSFRVEDIWVSPSKMDSEELYAFIEQRQASSNAKRARTMAGREEDESKQYLSRPHLDHLERSGLPDERGGRDIHPDDFLTSFGFRACEFGNWLPDIERQDVLNRAYDSLSTLARVLGVEKTFLSLGGTLALAFGSRGIGRALAHYEPARKVINLTRLKGAGSLAHEFWHALDDHLGTHLRGLVSQASIRGRVSDSYFATELFLTQNRVRGGGHKLNEIAQLNYVPGDLHERLAALVDGVNALTIRTFTEEEARAAALHKWGEGRFAVFSTLCQLLSMIHPSQSFDARRDFAERMTQEVCQEIAEDRVPQLRSGERHPLVQRMAQMKPETELSRKEDVMLSARLQNLSRSIGALGLLYHAAHDREVLLKSQHMQRLVNTKFFKDAEHFDAKKPKPYWSSVLELSARAFEAYVQDECAARGWRDDYLVHGTEESRFAGHQHATYPCGPDRERMKPAFDKLMSLVRNELSPGDADDHVANPLPRLKVA